MLLQRTGVVCIPQTRDARPRLEGCSTTDRSAAGPELRVRPTCQRSDLTTYIARSLAALFALLVLGLSLLAPSTAYSGTTVSGITDDEEGADIVLGPDATSRQYPRAATLEKQTPALFIGKQPKRKTVNFVEISKLRTASQCPWPMYVTLDVYRYPSGSPRDTSSRVRVGEAQFPTLVTNDQETSRWLTQEPLDLEEGESYGFVPTVVGTAWVVDPENEEEVRQRDLCLDAPLRTTTYPAVDPPDPASKACVRMPIEVPRSDGRVFELYRVWMDLATEASSAFEGSNLSTVDDVTAERICRGQETVAESGGSVWNVAYIDSLTGDVVSVRTVGAARQDTAPEASEQQLRERALAPLCPQYFPGQDSWIFGFEDLVRGTSFGDNGSGVYVAYAMHKCVWASWPPSDDDPSQSGWFWALPDGPGLPGPDGLRSPGQHQIIDAVLSSVTSAPGLTDPRETLGGVNPSADVPRCNTADPINCATGNFFEEYTDLSLPGRGVGLSVTRTYNAQAATPDPIGTAPQPGLFGRGWTSDFESRLLFTGSADSVVVRHGNGSTVPFTKQGGVWVGPDWARSTLTRNGTTASAGYVLTLPDRTKYTFHPTTGALLMVADERANKVLLTWSSGRLLKVAGGGRTFTFSYNDSGRVSAVSDGTGRSVAYGYSSAQELTSVTDVGGAVWSYAYDLRGRMTRKVDPRGAVVENVYDAQDRVTQQTDPLGGITRLEYLGVPSGSKVKVTDRSGVVSMKVFNKGVPISETRGYGTSKAATVRMAHNQRGQLRRLIDASGHATRYRYDERGNRTEVIDALGGSTRTTYDTLDRPVEVVSPAGRRTRLTYDGAGNVVSIFRDATSSAGADERLFTYDAYGQLLTATDPDGGVTSYTHDALGNQTSVTSTRGLARGPTSWGSRRGSSSTRSGRRRSLTSCSEPLARGQNPSRRLPTLTSTAQEPTSTSLTRGAG